MKNIPMFAALVALVSILAMPSDAVADRSCGRDSMTYVLSIEVKSGRPVAVTFEGKDAEDLRVCIGDTVEWELADGDEEVDFYVDFGGYAPFPGESSLTAAGGPIAVAIGGRTAKKGSVYKYTIGVVGGGRWDPRIIIEEN